MKIAIPFLLISILLFSSNVKAEISEVKVPIREFLIEMGYLNEDIKWDEQRLMVILNGHDFYSVLPREDNKTYGIKETMIKLIKLHKKGVYYSAAEMTQMVD